MRETEPVKPVSEEMVEQVLPHLPFAVRKIVELESLCAAKGGELVARRLAGRTPVASPRCRLNWKRAAFGAAVRASGRSYPQRRHRPTWPSRRLANKARTRLETKYTGRIAARMTAGLWRTRARGHLSGRGDEWSPRRCRSTGFFRRAETAPPRSIAAGGCAVGDPQHLGCRLLHDKSVPIASSFGRAGGRVNEPVGDEGAGPLARRQPNQGVPAFAILDSTPEPDFP